MKIVVPLSPRVCVHNGVERIKGGREGGREGDEEKRNTSFFLFLFFLYRRNMIVKSKRVRVHTCLISCYRFIYSSPSCSFIFFLFSSFVSFCFKRHLLRIKQRTGFFRKRWAKLWKLCAVDACKYLSMCLPPPLPLRRRREFRWKAVVWKKEKNDNNNKQQKWQKCNKNKCVFSRIIGNV